jgi:hypothetical protein
MNMIFWKSLAIALLAILGLSYVGFAYVYSQGGGITIAGMVTGGPHAKVVTLLKNSNITNLYYQRPLTLNKSVDISGYSTGFLYFQVFLYEKSSHPDPQWRPTLTLSVQFETDSILSGTTEIGSVYDTNSGVAFVKQIDLIGTKMWISGYATYEWAVMSISLYLRD